MVKSQSIGDWLFLLQIGGFVDGAQTIYQAATDGTGQFRYVVGGDAKMLIHMKENTDEEEYNKYSSAFFLKRENLK
ncbi:hypothetical protein JI735_08220 [Paenibacillus sonchi]|uniref:Uncharacterized protein n=1 Tax=Paenibacillus sonchi TaxID=373687 RepID=A0A974PES0_9BACL|nr:hypothetical protein [Paenibacillus sonchi]QQZ62549.1 hypothetical protein JI735_08220 [Paenibacillus sonchi]